MLVFDGEQVFTFLFSCTRLGLKLSPLLARRWCMERGGKGLATLWAHLAHTLKLGTLSPSFHGAWSLCKAPTTGNSIGRSPLIFRHNIPPSLSLVRNMYNATSASNMVREPNVQEVARLCVKRNHQKLHQFCVSV